MRSRLKTRGEKSHAWAEHARSGLSDLRFTDASRVPFPLSILCADEIGDYHAAVAAGYTSLIGSYGFDASVRLLTRGEVPAACIYDAPASLAQALRLRVARYDDDACHRVAEPAAAARVAASARS